MPLAGVPVRERERRVDLPKEPVSATVRRARVPEGGPPSFLPRLVSDRVAGGILPGVKQDWPWEYLLPKDHGVRAREAVVANVALVVGNIVKNQRHLGVNVDDDA